MSLRTTPPGPREKVEHLLGVVSIVIFAMLVALIVIGTVVWALS